MSANLVGQLRNTRRNITAVLLNLPIVATETSVATLLTMLDHFSDHPDEYRELLNDLQRRDARGK
jgi:cytochrome P450